MSVSRRGNQSSSALPWNSSRLNAQTVPASRITTTAAKAWTGRHCRGENSLLQGDPRCAEPAVKRERMLAQRPAGARNRRDSSAKCSASLRSISWLGMSSIIIFHLVSYFSSSTFMCCRARCSLDLTVPSAHPNASAVSDVVIPVKYLSMTTCLCSSDKTASAWRIAC